LKNGETNFWYSNIKKCHFNTPKVIWTNGTSDVIVDKNGDFGLTQFAYAIVDSIENLEHIKNAMLNPEFITCICGEVIKPDDPEDISDVEDEQELRGIEKHWFESVVENLTTNNSHLHVLLSEEFHGPTYCCVKGCSDNNPSYEDIWELLQHLNKFVHSVDDLHYQYFREVVFTLMCLHTNKSLFPENVVEELQEEDFEHLASLLNFSDDECDDDDEEHRHFYGEEVEEDDDEGVEFDQLPEAFQKLLMDHIMNHGSLEGFEMDEEAFRSVMSGANDFEDADVADLDPKDFENVE